MDVKFCRVAPSNQTLVDLFQGMWYSALPDEYQVNAGNVRHFDFEVEPRVKWVDSILPNGLTGYSVLELGPFEAYNTWQLEKLGAKPVISIENNNINFLKCLIVKELTGMTSKFLYGDFVHYLEQCPHHFDIVWASGVLYHQSEPLKLIELISKVTDKIFIHTHYFDEKSITGNANISVDFIPEKDSFVEHGGYSAKLHYRSYAREKANPIFASGPEEYSYWLERDDIFGYLKHLGFSRTNIRVDHKENPNGPAMFFFTERPAK